MGSYGMNQKDMIARTIRAYPERIMTFTAKTFSYDDGAELPTFRNFKPGNT
jgi:hypothetical protein